MAGKQHREWTREEGNLSISLPIGLCFLLSMKANGKKKPSKGAMLSTIRRSRGSLKRNMGDKPFAERMAEMTREEKELEERKLARLPSKNHFGTAEN